MIIRTDRGEKPGRWTERDRPSGLKGGPGLQVKYKRKVDVTDTREAMFTPVDSDYLPGDRARGPWHPDYLHGGPVGALVAHGLELQRDDDAFSVTRITMDLMRPVPVAPLSLSTRVVRSGRRVRYIEGAISAGGEVVTRISAVMSRRSGSNQPVATTLDSRAVPDWRDLPSGPWMNRPDSRCRFHAGLEVRLAGRPHSGEPVGVWVRVPYDLLPGTPLTPLERVGAIADLTNGTGMLSREGALKPFINSDITIHLFREPAGEWIYLHSAGRGDGAGLATSCVNLHDEEGLFGHSAVSAMINPLPD